MIEKTAIFKKIFRGLDEPSLDLLRDVAEANSYEAGHVLCRQGETEHIFYIVAEGSVAITRVSAEGEEQFLSICGPNDYFGELALLDDRPRMATCTTLEPTTVLEISEEAFDRLVEESPAIAYTITHQVVTNMRILDKLAIEDLTIKNAELSLAYQQLQEAQAAVVEKERMERELEIAAEVQRNLLPGKLPSFEDYQFHAYLEPANQIGGDFYDVISLEGGAFVGLLLADVVDKNVHAALYMAVTRTLFRAASRRFLSPAQVALAVHEGMLDISTNDDMFVTAFYGVLQRSSGRLTYVLAGHERPLLLRRGQQAQKLEGRGRFLGMIKSLELDEFDIDLEPGDRLLVFSDGVPDATAADGRQYGYDRLQSMLTEAEGLPLSDLVDYIADDIDRWTGDASSFDDLTMLAVART